MKTFVSFLIIALFPALAAAQPRTDATLRVTVVDPSGAVIVGATITLRQAQGERATGNPVEVSALETGPRGDATFTAIEPGRYTIHVESPGFEPSDARDVRSEERRVGKECRSRWSPYH